MNFELGAIGSLSFPMEQYVGVWHHFIFAYDGKEIEAFVDGQLVDSETASGTIKVSGSTLEIGRDSKTKGNYFIGLIDELQISYRPLDRIELGRAYFDRYALLVEKLNLPNGAASLFAIESDRKGDGEGEISVKSSRITIDRNLTATLGMKIDSPEPKNVSILIGADRFTKVYTHLLDSGSNNLEYRFDHRGLYWDHLAQTRLIVIDEKGNIVYDIFVFSQDLGLINNVILAFLAGILFACLPVTYRRNHSL